MFGMAIRLAERPYYFCLNRNDEDFQDYSYIWNGMWLAFVTMSTVGYGDYYPKTLFGRFLTIMCACCGIFIISLIVQVSISTAKFTK